ncbi:hypothetical protein BD410DRAFT_882703 [Rickenella mellea]|uniref:Uncharacterized protein n=1 Tax=Rickenella mellea TaxID=50990 RepID=A0A4Y7PTE5_9AGAM|nr:hypothetical protein BD410DRAFT_882703 [Rickenella mellea]
MKRILLILEVVALIGCAISYINVDISPEFSPFSHRWHWNTPAKTSIATDGPDQTAISSTSNSYDDATHPSRGPAAYGASLRDTRTLRSLVDDVRVDLGFLSLQLRAGIVHMLLDTVPHRVVNSSPLTPTMTCAIPSISSIGRDLQHRLGGFSPDIQLRSFMSLSHTSRLPVPSRPSTTIRYIHRRTSSGSHGI